jgi:nicotinamidase-related amidase
MPHRSALLLVDFQRDFLADNGRMPISRSQVEPLIIQTNRAISAARAQGVPIVAVANEFSPDDRLMNVLRRNAAIAGSEGAAWDERVTVHDAPYFTKTRGDAFSNERLRDHLATLGIEEVVLAGLMAKACITATTRGAIAAGLSVRVLGGAVADTSDRAKATALRRLAALPGVRVERAESSAFGFEFDAQAMPMYGSGALLGTHGVRA